MKTRFCVLKDGDIINLDKVLYVHLSKSEECAYVYIGHLMHGENEFVEDHGNIFKRIRVSLEDYDNIVELINKG
jgi:hypothetical protein